MEANHHDKRVENPLEIGLREERLEAERRLDAPLIPDAVANALAPEQSLLLDEYFLHRRRQVCICMFSSFQGWIPL